MGEQEPVNEKGKCNQSDFFSVDGKLCGFVGRVDVLKHFMATGGFWGAKETIQKLSRWKYNFITKFFIYLNINFSSIFTFINYYHNIVSDSSIQEIFDSAAYKKEINKICSAGYKLNQTQEMIFHPLQINIAMIAPGQDLPLHQVQNIFL